MLYKSDKGVSDEARPPENGPTEAGGFSGLKSATEHWPSDTDARQSAENPLHEAVANQA